MPAGRVTFSEDHAMVLVVVLAPKAEESKTMFKLLAFASVVSEVLPTLTSLFA